MHRQRITDPAFHERFWSRVRVSDGCWLWTGRRTHHDYGVVVCEGKAWRVHRVAWMITHGPIPDGLSCCHRCDQPLCCRPDHLFLGTHTDNMRDMSAKGRQFTPMGEHHYLTYLTDENVRAIRQRRTEGWTYARIAADFGISASTVASIVTYQRWKHVT